MRKCKALIFSLVMLLCGVTAFTAFAQEGEEAEGVSIKAGIENGSFIIRIPDESGDLGWIADDMVQDDSVVTLASEGLENGEYVVQYDPAGDGEVTVAVRHYMGFACDQIYTWDLTVGDGAVQENTGGSFSASPDEADQDPYICGKWLEGENQLAEMNITKGEGTGWDVVIVSPEAENAYVFKTTVHFDCDKNGFVYDKGKFWDLPAEGYDGSTSLGEAAVYGTVGTFTFTGDPVDLWLSWVDDRDPEKEVNFQRVDPAAETPGAGEDAEISADSLHASIQRETDSPEWVAGLPAAQDENTSQLFVIAGMGMDKTTATVSMHERAEDGTWKQILSTPGYVGKNGLCPDADHAEGCAQTPLGVYHFNKAFGIADDPGCQLSYIKVDDNIYWSGDENEHYNEMVDIRDYPELDMTNSEHISDYEYEYQYCLNISFNEDGTPGRGSAIFLHCLGKAKPYTGGCVALPENIMKLVMQNVREDCVVVIDTFENMGGSF